MQGRRWCFTLNNPVREDGPTTTNYLGEECKFIVMQRERGSNGTSHLQGYAEFTKPIRLAGLKKLLPGAHWEMAKGTKQQCITYCTKEETREAGPWMDGPPTEKTLFELARDLSQDEFILQCIRMRIPFGYYNLIYSRTRDNSRTIRDFVIPPQGTIQGGLSTLPITMEPETIVINGPSGIGKSLWAKINSPKPALMVTHIDDLKYLTDEHKCIIFDDMDFKHTPRTAQIHLVDQHDGRSIHVRYGTARIKPHIHKIFTCNELPFIDDPAIKRRIKVHTFYQ